jgi:hypothetical protein
MFFLPLLLVIGIIFRGQKTISVIENRALTKFPKITLQNFKKGILQNQLESALVDQCILSQFIKNQQIKSTTNITEKLSNFILNIHNWIMNSSSHNYYIKIRGDLYHYGSSDYIIDRPKYPFNYDSVKKIYNNIKCSEKYIYFIETSAEIDFNNISKKEEIFQEIKNNFEAKDYARFTINSYEDLEKYFYQTDHHWNYIGQLRGYKQIINLLLGKNEKTLEPIDEVTYNVIFNGSRSRNTLTETSKEKFTVYKYNLPNFKSYINDQEKQYGNHELYDDGKFSTDVYTNHYGEYYGMDYAKVTYDFNNPDKKNLLMFVTSFSNPINELIASHFNKTYIIDFRPGQRIYKGQNDFTKFIKDNNKFIKDNNIDKVLIIGSIFSFKKREN